MKKFYYSILWGAMLMCASHAMADVPKDVTVEPENNSTLVDLSKVEIYFDYDLYTGTLEATDAADNITVTCDGQPFNGLYYAMADYAMITIYFDPAVTQTGTYDITIPAGAYKDVPDEEGQGGSSALTPAISLTYNINADLPVPRFIDAVPASGSSVEMLDSITLHLSNPQKAEIKCQGMDYFKVSRIIDGKTDGTYYNYIKSSAVKGDDVVLHLGSPIITPGNYDIDIHDYAVAVGTEKLKGFTLNYTVTGPQQAVNAASVTRADQDLTQLLPDQAIELAFNVKNIGTNNINTIGYKLQFKAADAADWELYEQRTNIELDRPLAPEAETAFTARFRTPSTPGNYMGKLSLVRVNGATSNNTNTTETSQCEFPFTIATSGILSIESTPTIAEYFDLQGRRVPNPVHGIYLQKIGNKVAKIIR